MFKFLSIGFRPQLYFDPRHLLSFCRMFFLLSQEIQIIEYFLKIMETFLAWTLFFSLVVIITIPLMTQWTDYCMHYICCFGIYLLVWNFNFISSLSTISDIFKSFQNRPGSIQVRGENLFSVLKAFSNSSKLENVHERESLEATANENKDERAIFFDYLTFFIVRCSNNHYSLCMV